MCTEFFIGSLSLLAYSNCSDIQRSRMTACMLKNIRISSQELLKGCGLETIEGVGSAYNLCMRLTGNNNIRGIYFLVGPHSCCQEISTAHMHSVSMGGCGLVDVQVRN
jgi:hypothetical protein